MVYKRVQLDKKILLFKISHGYASNMIYYFIFLLYTESMADCSAKNRIFLSQPDAGKWNLCQRNRLRTQKAEMTVAPFARFKKGFSRSNVE